MPRQQTSRWSQRVAESYERLGCAAFLCLFIAAVIGLFVARRIGFCVAICLQYGREAYFRDGIRSSHLPHPGNPSGHFRLSNGQTLAPQYQGVVTLVSLVAIPVWIAAAFVVVTAINNRLERRRDRRLARKARTPTGGEV